MIASPPRRRWARNTPLTALLIATCLVLPAIGATAGAAAARPKGAATPRSNNRNAITGSWRTPATAARFVPRLLAIAAKRSITADRILIARARALRKCLNADHKHLARCKFARRAVQRASSRLARVKRRVSSLLRRTGKANSNSHTTTSTPEPPALALADPAGTPIPLTTTPPSSPLTPTPTSPAPVPTPPAPTPTTAASVPADKIIGSNDAAGWGPAAAKTILAGHITWNRVEIGSEDNTLSASLSDGFHALAIVGNVNDNTPLSQIEPNSWAATVVSQLQANPGIAIAEAGNEMFFKGDAANPVQYGRMYLAAVNAMKAAGIHTPLLFDMFGDYPVGSLSSSTWSRDSSGGGWLRDAVTGVPGLASAILANGLSTHPYGALGEDSTDSWGVNAVAAQEAVAQTVLGATPPFYITEFGYDLGSCGETDGACSQQEQADKMRSAYAVFLSDPHVAGIWCYQSHDDPTGQWGYMNNDNTIRPAFEVISSIATAQGQ